MNKVKKVLAAIGAFFVGMMPNIFAMAQIIETKYGVYEPSPCEKVSVVGKIVIPIILFIIGLFSIFTKKLTKRMKIIVVSVLVALGVIGCALMDFISMNF